VRVIGCGEAFAEDGSGNTSYLLERPSRSNVLFDCGYQIPERLWREGLHESIDAICLTHHHADHAFGIVPLLVRFWEEKRAREIVIIGPRGTSRWVPRALDLGYPGLRQRFGYPIRFITLQESGKKAQTWDGLEFRGARTQHSVLNLSIRVDHPGAWSFAVSGDGRHTRESLELLEGVNVLFQELFALEKAGPMHEDWQALRRELPLLGIGQVWMAHPSRSERTRVEVFFRSGADGMTGFVELATSGLSVSLSRSR